ncbi:hypothetical protein LTR37_010547 [Vermiconidia calcicola]|uniref:Uncharacterized protein n=1 Tax=Vermiconidia calcicola TaxID=1690605 RepID=A0ACC3N587_9PEZI|nr:hypothetical protein LTR37_010547 [Vermiconidia calcicola]
MGSAGNLGIREVDCLIVGAGFGAVTLLHKLLQQGFDVKVYEKGSTFGGIWHWNCYPGARVDTDTPIYQLFDKEIWEDFTFKERYSGWQDLRRYFEHVDKKWGLREHFEFNKNVDTATFDEEQRKWLVECSDGSQTWCRYFMPCLGFAAKKHIPNVPGISNFKGEVYHTGIWPQYGVNLKGKRIAQIGTGASGIQVIQEIGDSAKHLTIYQRTPNLCLPMNQRKLDVAEEDKRKAEGYYEESMKATRNTFAGFDYDFMDKNTFDDSPEEREKIYHKLMVEQGGFRFWLNTYKDMLFVQEANDEAYKFWRDTTRKRIKDPKKQELLAPINPPHPWGTKRPSLEQRFYEVVDQPHVDIIDINESPIEGFEENGVRSKLEGVVEVDVIVLATGFDSVSGSLAQLNIQGTNGGTIADHWKDGLRTATGIAIPGFPNMFFLYGPQAPTAFANGPSCTQYQADWVVDFLVKAREDGINRVEPTEEAEKEWTERMHEAWKVTLFPKAKSWYQGNNIPGKRVEPLNWAGGIPAYLKTLEDSLENDYQGWKTSK